MKRKINRVGNGTLTVSLPNKWVEKYHLEKGREIEVEEEGAILKIKAAETNEKREITFKITESEKYMERIITAPYLKGYDTIRLNYSETGIYAKILGGLRHTVGFEIVEQKDGFCKIEEISKGSDEKFEKLITRFFHVVRTFAKETRTFLSNPKNPDDLLEIEYTCDRIALYCRRLINKNIVSGKTQDNTGMYNVVCLLERVGDELRQIIEYLKKNNYKGQDNKQFDSIFQKIDESFEITMKKVNNYLEKKDTAKQIELAFEQRRIKRETDSIQKEFFRKKEDNLIITHHLLNIFEHIQHMSEELF